MLILCHQVTGDVHLHLAERRKEPGALLVGRSLTLQFQFVNLPAGFQFGLVLRLAASQEVVVLHPLQSDGVLRLLGFDPASLLHPHHSHH